MSSETRTALAAAGLFAAWALHDAEEALTFQSSGRSLLRRLPGNVRPPAFLVRAIEAGPEQYRVAIGLMGALVAAATVDGLRTGGRGRLFQWSLNAFGWHGVWHLAASAALRGYTTGVATSPVIVIPYWLWAVRALRQEGVRVSVRPDASLLLLVPLLLGSHALAGALVGAGRSLGRSTH